MTAKINDIGDFIKLMREVSTRQNIDINPDKLDPDMVLLCFSLYTEGYNTAINFVDDCINRLSSRNGGEK